MLVLSRKQNQRIVFPHLNIAVEVVRVSGKVVRLGVDAPENVKILREEVAEPSDYEATQAGPLDRQAIHDLRNQLHTANLFLHVLRMQMKQGKLEDAEDTIEEALQKFAEVDQLAAIASHAKTGPSALIVEDNAQERELLAGYLELCGYQVETVANGAEAIGYLDEHARPDVVLLDMHMPRMNGAELVSEIRANPRFRDLKLIAISASDSQSIATDSKHGVDRWYSKPLNPQMFVEQLREEIAV